jgi:hypothetical protein
MANVDGAIAFQQGIGNFGFSGTLPNPTAASILSHFGLAGKPFAAAPKEYFEACKREGLRPCLACHKLPLIEPRHTCDKCDANLHAHCGAAVSFGRNRCLDCCKEHGVPEDAENAEAIVLRNHPRNTAQPAAAPPPPPRPLPLKAKKREKAQPPDESAKTGRRQRKKKEDRLPNTGVVEAIQVEIALPPEDQPIPMKSQYHGMISCLIFARKNLQSISFFLPG